MTRALFIARLRQGLKGLSADEIADIVLDYEAHFSDAAVAGRNESDVAASLGDPLQLGQEISAETKLRRWERRRSPHNFLRAGFALTGLQTLTPLVVLPILALILVCAGIAAYVLFEIGRTGLNLLMGLASGNGIPDLPCKGVSDITEFARFIHAIYSNNSIALARTSPPAVLVITK